MPHWAVEYPTTLLINKNNINTARLFVGEDEDYINFGLLFKSDWEIVRLLWIGYLKNDENELCQIGRLSKDVILLIINFLHLSFVSFNDALSIIRLIPLKDSDSNESTDYGDGEDNGDDE